jgi:hypothetical protein
MGGTTSGEIVQWKGTNSCGTGTSPAGQDIISPNRERNLPLPVVYEQRRPTKGDIVP